MHTLRCVVCAAAHLLHSLLLTQHHGASVTLECKKAKQVSDIGMLDWPNATISASHRWNIPGGAAGSCTGRGPGLHCIGLAQPHRTARSSESATNQNQLPDARLLRCVELIRMDRGICFLRRFERIDVIVRPSQQCPQHQQRAHKERAHNPFDVQPYAHSFFSMALMALLSRYSASSMCSLQSTRFLRASY